MPAAHRRMLFSAIQATKGGSHAQGLRQSRSAREGPAQSRARRRARTSRRLADEDQGGEAPRHGRVRGLGLVRQGHPHRPHHQEHRPAFLLREDHEGAHVRREALPLPLPLREGDPRGRPVRVLRHVLDGGDHRPPGRRQARRRGVPQAHAQHHHHGALAHRQRLPRGEVLLPHRQEDPEQAPEGAARRQEHPLARER